MLKSWKKRLARSTSTSSEDSKPAARTKSSTFRLRSKPLDVEALTQPVPHLAVFDACLEAADRLEETDRRSSHGLPLCNVLVSPSGQLLWIPDHDHTFATLVQKFDYDTSIYVGNDLEPAINGFSCKGWSVPATSLALQQSRASLEQLRTYLQSIRQARSQCAEDASKAREQYEDCRTASSNVERMQDWELVDPKSSDFEWTERRVGPLLYGSLKEAVDALVQYKAGEVDLLEDNATLESLQTALHSISERVEQRQLALEESSRRARRMEDRIEELKKIRARKWNAVYLAEERVNKRIEETLREKSRRREKKQLKELQKERDDKQQTNLGATSEEIWDLVSSVTESMENGSFEPMDLPAAPISSPKDKSSLDEDEGVDTSVADSDTASEAATISRETVEQEVGLPQLRAAAMAADDDIEDAGGYLLQILSNIDTTRRSARLVAETSLVSACQAQVTAVRSFLSDERKMLEKRLQDLEEAEKAVKDITIADIKRDLDVYIRSDKKEKGGLSHLSDDDDGGIASALAILNSHVEGSLGHDTHEALAESESESNDDDHVTTEVIQEALELLFEDNMALQPNASEAERTRTTSQLSESIKLLCETATGSKHTSRMRRSAMCYALNSKRSSHTEIPSQIQFDQLCRLFSAILTGCSNEERGVTNAKMCIMLAQTFYIRGEEKSTDDILGSPNSAARQRRIYVKSKLRDHPIWSKEEFWDEALSQQISESLTHSGVMSNFERQKRAQAPSGKKSEWAQTHKTKWHDLSYTERIEAAAQVHAVVFAQLGALAHSMIELGCGLERSCGFVRRMSIRHQLPSSQRSMLLKHLIDRNKTELSETSTPKESDTNGTNDDDSDDDSDET